MAFETFVLPSFDPNIASVRNVVVKFDEERLARGQFPSILLKPGRTGPTATMEGTGKIACRGNLFT